MTIEQRIKQLERRLSNLWDFYDHSYKENTYEKYSRLKTEIEGQLTALRWVENEGRKQRDFLAEALKEMAAKRKQPNTEE